MSSYRDALDQEAFGHVPVVPGVEPRDEDSLPLDFTPRPDGVYFHAQDRVWRVRFGGADRFETFGVEQYDAANTLFKRLCDEGAT